MKSPAGAAIAALLLCGPGLWAASSMLRTGSTTHEIDGVVAVEALPKQWTQSRFAKLAAERPAPAGYVYVVIKGKVTNSSAENRSLRSSFLWLEDGTGAKYTHDGTSTVIYQPEGTGISSMPVPKGATKAWIGFFPVPKGSTGLRLMATDLRTRKGEPVSLPISDPKPGKAPNASWLRIKGMTPPPEPGELSGAVMVGVWVLDEAASKGAKDGTVTGVRRVTVKPDGTFSTALGFTGKWRVSGGRFLVTYRQSPASRIDEAAATSGKYLKWPAPTDGRHYGYLLKE